MYKQFTRTPQHLRELATGKVLIHQHAKDYHLLLARDVDGAVVAILALLIGRMPPMVQKSFLADLMQDTPP